MATIAHTQWTGLFGVRYPSGRHFTLFGRFFLTEIGEHAHPCIEREDGSVWMIDPRAVVTMGKTLAYSPRWHLDRLCPEMLEWLVKNPAWPGRCA